MSVGVRMVSGWGLRVSGDLLIPNLFANKLYKVMILRYCLFFQCPVLHKNAYAWGCLDGVCGCLTVSRGSIDVI